MSVVKEYTVKRLRIVTREELAEMLKKAHEECKAEVKPTYHQIGKSRKRATVSRPAVQYRECIKRKINEYIKSKLSGVAG